MAKPSRRSFLAGAGAVTTVVVTPAAGAFAAPSASSAPSAAKGPATQPLVAHVSDPRSGTLVLYVGTDALVVHDPALVQRLTRAAGRR
jgi:hypothetical protein